MAQCSDCYSVRILGNSGDGKCRTCYGTGDEQGLGGGLSDFIGQDRASCSECGGSGVCQTCGGSGEI